MDKKYKTEQYLNHNIKEYIETIFVWVCIMQLVLHRKIQFMNYI